MKLIVCEPVKIAGQVAKPGDVIDAGKLKLTDAFVEDLLVSDLVAVFEDSEEPSDPKNPAPPQDPPPKDPPPKDPAPKPPRRRTSRT